MPYVRLLGPVDVVDDEGVARTTRSALRRTLLSLLALKSRRVIDADRLLDEAWNGTPPASGLRALRFHISRLRSELAIEGLVVTVGSGYRLDADTDIEVVIRRLEEGVDVRTLASLTTMWRGQPLFGTSPCTVLEHERLRLDELQLTITERLVQARSDSGDATVVSDLTRLSLDHPLRERLWATLINAHYRGGNHAEALRTVARLRHTLRDQLGVDPSPEIQQLEQQILDHTAPAQTQSASSSSSMGCPQGNLSTPASIIYGRTAAIADVYQLLDAHRLVTILGPGGVGKTRLAIEVAARRRAAHDDGVWFCDLSSVSGPETVPYVVAESLDVNDYQGRSITNGVVSWLSTKDALLVLDNCEQVRVAVRDLVDALLGACPQVRILATSREPIRQENEQRYLLEPLPPDTDAVELFWARASLINSHLDRENHGASVVAICRMLDGLPLAVELAAVHCGALTPAEIALRLTATPDLLRDNNGPRPDRQRTLSATIDWSTEALESHDRRLLGELSIFAGGFTLRAAEGVCTNRSPAGDGIQAGLEILVERSLVYMVVQTSGAARYRILEPIRQHVADSMSVKDRQAINTGHARWFAKRAHELQDALVSPSEAEAMIETTAELANFRQAHRWAVRNEPSTAAELVSGLLQYEISRLHTEIGAWFDQTLDVLDTDDPWFPSVLAAATMGSALHRRTDEMVEAYKHLDDTNLSPFLRDNAAISLAGAARARTGDLRPMENLANRALTDGDPFMATLALGQLNRCEEALVVAERSGIPSAIAYANLHVARIAAGEGRDVDAEIHLSRAIASARSVSSWLPLARALVQWAIVAERLGLDRDDIERVLDESDAIIRRSGLSDRTWTAIVRQDTPELPAKSSASVPTTDNEPESEDKP